MNLLEGIKKLLAQTFFMNDLDVPGYFLGLRSSESLKWGTFCTCLPTVFLNVWLKKNYSFGLCQFLKVKKIKKTVILLCTRLIPALWNTDPFNPSSSLSCFLSQSSQAVLPGGMRCVQALNIKVVWVPHWAQNLKPVLESCLSLWLPKPSGQSFG